MAHGNVGRGGAGHQASLGHIPDCGCIPSVGGHIVKGLRNGRIGAGICSTPVLPELLELPELPLLEPPIFEPPQPVEPELSEPVSVTAS